MESFGCAAAARPFPATYMVQIESDIYSQIGAGHVIGCAKMRF